MGALTPSKLDMSNGNQLWPFYISGSGISQNTWYDTGYQRTGQYQHSGAFIMINFSNQDGDANNIWGIHRSPTSTAYLGGVAGTTWTNVTGSSSVEAKWVFVSGTTYKVQVRTTHSAAGGTYETMHGWLFLSDA